MQISQFFLFTKLITLFCLIIKLLLYMNQRKHNTNKKQPSQTPTKTAIHSPSKHIPFRSPLTTSKFNVVSNNKSTVSYGELQIVLDNLQQIRRKASQQINQLTGENKALRQEMQRKQQQSEELSNRLNRSSYSKHQFQSKIIEQLQNIEADKKRLTQEIKQKDKIQNQLEANNVELQHTIRAEKQKNRALQDKIIQLQDKWKWAFTILAANHQRAEQLIWKVKDQYEEGIWTLLQTSSRQSHQLGIKTTKLQILQQQISQFKDSFKQNVSLLEKSMAEVSALSAKLHQSEEQINLLKDRCAKAEQQEQKRTGELKLKLSQSSNIINTLESRVALLLKQKQIDFHQLEDKNARLENQLSQKSKTECFQMLISEVCEQSQDYSEILQRLRYLQNFKVEHYLNVEKIQFLCKMLDN